MAVNIGIEDLEYFFKKRLEYLGLGSFSTHLFEEADLRGYNLVVRSSKNIPIKDLMLNNPAQIIHDTLLEGLQEDILNSGLILALKEFYEKEIQTLKDKIQTLEKQNMDLSEAFTNGIEMLGEDYSEDS